MCDVTHVMSPFPKISAIYDTPGREQWETLGVHPSCILPCVPLPLADRDLCPFTVTNRGCDCHTFQ